MYHIYIYIYIHTHISLSLSLSIYIYIYIHICICIYSRQQLGAFVELFGPGLVVWQGAIADETTKHLNTRTI